MRAYKDLKIAVAGTGYVGLSMAVLLAQNHCVTAVDIVPEKVEMLNNRISPIRDEYIEKYLAEKKLNLTATLDGVSAYLDADFVVVAAPTNYDEDKHVFDTSAFTVDDGKVLDSYMADVDTDADYTGDTEVISDGYFHESEYRSVTLEMANEIAEACDFELVFVSKNNKKKYRFDDVKRLSYDVRVRDGKKVKMSIKN